MPTISYVKAKTQKEANEVLFTEMRRVIREYRQKHDGKTSSRALMRALYLVVLDAVFRQTIERGSCRLPAGLGSMRMKHMPTLRRKIPKPGGQVVDVDRPRLRIRYQSGAQVDRLLGYGHYHDYQPKSEEERKIGRRDEFTPLEGLEPLVEPVVESADSRPGV